MQGDGRLALLQLRPKRRSTNRAVERVSHLDGAELASLTSLVFSANGEGWGARARAEHRNGKANSAPESSMNLLGRLFMCSFFHQEMTR